MDFVSPPGPITSNRVLLGATLSAMREFFSLILLTPTKLPTPFPFLLYARSLTFSLDLEGVFLFSASLHIH